MNISEIFNKLAIHMEKNIIEIHLFELFDLIGTENSAIVTDIMDEGRKRGYNCAVIDIDESIKDYIGHIIFYKS